MNLHGQIMDIQAPRDVSGQPIGWSPAYLEGHRDARHAAAELALKADAINVQLLEALKLIASTDPVDAALDPQRAVRVATAAIRATEGEKA